MPIYKWHSLTLWKEYSKKATEISKSVYTGIKFSSGDISWEALRVILALRLHVLPSQIDDMPFPEVSQILAVLDGQSKAGAGEIR